MNSNTMDLANRAGSITQVCSSTKVQSGSLPGRILHIRREAVVKN